MKFIRQTKHHTETQDGNCFATCIACLLELDEIPEFDLRSEDHRKYINDFLNTKGYNMVDLTFGEKQIIWIPNNLIGIAFGKSPIQPNFEKDKEHEFIQHCVIARFFMEDGFLKSQILHDPNSRELGIETLNGIVILTPLFV